MPASNKSNKKRARTRGLFDPLRFELPQDSGLQNLEIFVELNQSLQRYLGGGGDPGSRLQRQQQALRERLAAGHSLADCLKTPGDARALITLWREDGEFLAQYPPGRAALKSLEKALPQLSRQLLWQLCQVYFEHYDRLPELSALSRYLAKSLDDAPESLLQNPEMRAYHGQRAWLFGRDAVGALLEQARQQQVSLPRLAGDYHLPLTGRLGGLALEQAYLRPLETLAPGEDSPLFSELAREEIKQVPLSDGLLLGHHAARLLMDKVLARGEGLPENWRYVITGILDDPRVPRASPRFQTWWARLDRKYLKAMRAWLSQLDLKLFLNILEDVAHSHNKQDLLRMFPARKRFLEGLYTQGVISESRLLLGSRAEKYIRETFDPQALPEYGRLNSSDVSLIYLNLQGAHFIEGTHLFQVRLYRDLPVPGLADYEEQHFNLTGIRKYKADFTVRHGRGGKPRWQKELLEILFEEFKLNIQPSNVLSAADYQAYCQLPADKKKKTAKA